MKNKLFILLLMTSCALSAGKIEEDIESMDITGLYVRQLNVKNKIDNARSVELKKLYLNKKAIICSFIEELSYYSERNLLINIGNYNIQDLLQKHNQNQKCIQELKSRKNTAPQQPTAGDSLFQRPRVPYSNPTHNILPPIGTSFAPQQRSFSQQLFQEEKPVGSFGWFGPFVPKITLPIPPHQGSIPLHSNATSQSQNIRAPYTDRSAHGSFPLIPSLTTNQQQPDSNLAQTPYHMERPAFIEPTSTFRPKSLSWFDETEMHNQSYTAQFATEKDKSDNGAYSPFSSVPQVNEKKKSHTQARSLTDQKAIEYLRRQGAQDDEIINALGISAKSYIKYFPKNPDTSANMQDLEHSYTLYLNKQTKMRVAALQGLTDKYSVAPEDRPSNYIEIDLISPPQPTYEVPMITIVN